MGGLLDYIKIQKYGIKVWTVVISIIILCILPTIKPPGYFIHLINWIFMYSILAESFNIIAGIAGQFSLGHAMFFGLGAYTATFMALAGYPFIVSVLAGGIVALLFSFPIGYVTLKTREIYFAMATLAAAEIFRLIFTFRPELGGAIGLSLPITYYTESFYYYFWLAIFLATVTTTWLIINSRFGLALMSIRDNELAALVNGVNITWYKVIAFAVSSFFPGLAGAVYAYYIGHVSPDSVFSAMISIDMQVMSILGGLGTVSGPILGAGILTILSEWIGYTMPEIHLLIDGVIMAAVMILMPEGLAGLLKYVRYIPKASRMKIGGVSHG